MIQRGWITLSLVFGLLSVCQAESKLPEPQIETLSNGLTVAWFHDPRLPLVDVSLVVSAGKKSDLPHQSGVAELLAQTLTEVPLSGGSQPAWAELGVSPDSIVDEDSMLIGFHGLSRDAGALLELLGKITLHATIQKEHLALAQERYLQRMDHSVGAAIGLTTQVYRRLLSKGGPDGRSGVLNLKAIQNFKVGDLQAFYQTHFVPEKSILVLAGRLDVHELRAAVQTVFGGWSSKAPVSSIPPKAPRLALRSKATSSQPVFLLEASELPHAQIRMGLKGPSARDPDFYPLLVANTILGGGVNSRLNSQIRDPMGVTYSLGSTLSLNRDDSELTIHAVTRNDKVGPVIRRIQELIAAFPQDPLSSAEVSAAQDFLLGGFALQASSLSSVVSLWLNGRVFGLDPHSPSEFPAKVQAVSVQRVKEVAKKYIQANHLVVLVSGRVDEMKKSMASSKLRNLKQVVLTDLQ
ncbi:MAG: M16 family metallopeptidase [Bdellovibrionia bacterium]